MEWNTFQHKIEAQLNNAITTQSMLAIFTTTHIGNSFTGRSILLRCLRVYGVVWCVFWECDCDVYVKFRAIYQEPPSIDDDNRSAPTCKQYFRPHNVCWGKSQSDYVWPI